MQLASQEAPVSGAALTVARIESMSYVDFIALLRETNRCPGGKQTIRKILQNAFVDSASTVLEVGSNTGFTSLEIARVAGCKVKGIDPVASAVAVARAEVARDVAAIQRLVSFDVASAYKIPHGNDTFDLLVAGGATSFMDNKNQALREYRRVIKPWGFLSVTNLCYFEPPPTHVTRAVSEILGVSIAPWTAEQWRDVFLRNDQFELYCYEKTFLGAQPEHRIDTYVDTFLEKPHLRTFDAEVRAAIRKRWRAIMHVFNENHRYLGFISAMFRKRHLVEEPELFLAPS